MSQGYISPHEAGEAGMRGRPPYSVETPYGFQLDLDFLKYVDDIEKGNTIKRVSVQRRSRGPRASTLPRHLAPPGGGRPGAWGSTGALGPRSRASDAQRHGCWAYDHRPPLSPSALMSLVEMEARIREFDEQPLGEHVRPHLLRASSLPLTVLLRRGSESAESVDAAAGLRGSSGCLRGRNTSCEDVFLAADGALPADCPGLLRRLNEALERVGELELEARVIPELRAQVRFLQEETQRLRLGPSPTGYPSSANGAADARRSSRRGKADGKRPRHEAHAAFPGNRRGSPDASSQEWRSSTDLDELLTVTALQAKVAALEQKLHEAGLELRRLTGLLREQQEESRSRDHRIQHLVRNPAPWVRAERVVVDGNGDEAAARPAEPHQSKAPFTRTRTGSTTGREQDSTVGSPGPLLPSDPPAEAADAGAAVRHIQRIRSLLDQQWRSVCAESTSGEDSELLKHPDPKVNTLQEEMMRLVDVLASYYQQRGRGGERHAQNGASESPLWTDGCVQAADTPLSEGAGDGSVTRGSGSLDDVDGREQGVHGAVGQSGGGGARETDAGPARRAGPDRRTTSTAEDTRGTARSKTQREAQATSDPEASGGGGGGETISPDFMAACHFLKDHMDDMENPDDDVRKALIVLFQTWFGAAAEEASVSGRVSLYLREVRSAAPALLAFLVNLADDNGNTALHYSVSHCNYDIVGLLLDTGAVDVNVQNNAGYTAAMLASLTAPDRPAGMEVVRRLMELGSIDVRSRQEGQTALSMAVQGCHTDTAALLQAHAKARAC